MRFQILRAVSVKIRVFWVIAMCRLAEVYRRFGDKPRAGLQVPEQASSYKQCFPHTALRYLSLKLGRVVFLLQLEVNLGISFR
jgi:hypothetical protein